MNEKGIPLPAPVFTKEWKDAVLSKACHVRVVCLSARQVEVLKLYAEGWSTFEIATKLQKSKSTIDTFRCQIMAKTGLRNTADFARAAIAMGLIEVEVIA